MDGSSDDTLLTNIERFRCHPSVVKIKTTVCSCQRFSFRQITIQEMFDQLIILGPKKQHLKKLFFQKSSKKMPIYFPHRLQNLSTIL